MNPRIHELQQELASRLGLQPQPLAPAQYVRVETSALQADAVVGRRSDDEQDPFTGWELVPVSGSSAGWEFGQYSASELARLRPAWLVPLCLPMGWSFRCAGDTLVDVVDPQGVTRSMMLKLDVPRGA